MGTMESRILYSGTGLDGVHMTAVGRTWVSCPYARCDVQRDEKQSGN